MGFIDSYQSISSILVLFGGQLNSKSDKGPMKADDRLQPVWPRALDDLDLHLHTDLTEEQRTASLTTLTFPVQTFRRSHTGPLRNLWTDDK